MDLKHVVVVDDDIDVFDPIDVEWAIATRVQGDQDVIDHPRRARQAARPEPAVTPPASCRPAPRSASTPPSREGIPRERFERIAYAYADRAKIDDYVNGKADASRRQSADDAEVARAGEGDPGG